MAQGSWTAEAIATFIAAAISALVAAVSVVLTTVERRAARRRAAAEAHRDQWWTRWSWIAEHAFSSHPEDQQAAMVVLDLLVTLPWSTTDDRRMAVAITRRRLTQETEEPP